MYAIQEAFPLLDTPKRIVLTTHHKPDGDAMGSMLGMYHFLKSLGHEVTPISPNEVPDFLLWMPGMEAVYNFEAEPKTCIPLINNAELIFALDYNHFSRVKHLELYISQSAAIKLLIDHHLYPQPIFDYGISIPEKSSTCELVYDVIVQKSSLSALTQDIASCLYTGVMTDTGSFRFPIVTADVHEMVANLKRAGLAHDVVHEAVYDYWSENRMRFIGKMLYERMEIFPEWQAGLITVYKQDLEKFQLSNGDTEGLVNYPLSIKGVRFATLITERPDEVRLSFRSKGNFDVNKFARENFEGGGHFHASGGRSALPINETVTRFKQILSEFHPE